MSKIERGSTNVYADLGMANAEEMLVKAQLATKILNARRHGAAIHESRRVHRPGAGRTWAKLSGAQSAAISAAEAGLRMK